MMIAALVALLAMFARVGRSSRRRPAPSPVVDLVELLALGAAAGMSLHESLRWSRDFVAPATADELGQLLRRARSVGLAQALQTTGGAPASLYRLLARSIETGAAVGPALSAFRDRAIADDLARVEAELQRLPVKLAFPLALLMLPGLLLMIVAPALLDVLSRFG